MNRKLRKFKILAGFAFVLLCSPQLSRASHVAGADLTYLCVAPGIYVVTGKIYRDCMSASLNTSEVLTIKSPGCNNGRILSMPLAPGTPGPSPPPLYYCPSAASQAACNSTATLPNIETGTYRATITFSAAERNCSNWLLSLSLATRPTIENLANSSAFNVYAEAYLKLSNTINNNSPEFSPAFNAIPVICVNQDNSVAVNTADPDGDSLSYELAQPLSDYNAPIAYAANTNIGSGNLPPSVSAPVIDPATGNCMLINLNVAPSCSSLFKTSILDPRSLPYQTAILPASYCSGSGNPGAGMYSANAPLPVSGLAIDWVTGCQTNIQAKPGDFRIDPLTGVIRFRPNVFHSSIPQAGRNKYATVVQINEWRKINGVMAKVGHVRRDFIIQVSQCANIIPAVSFLNPAPVTGAVIQEDIIKVYACSSTSFTIRHSDPDPGNQFNVYFPDMSFSGNTPIFPSIPGLVIMPFTNNQNQINTTFTVTPPPSSVGKVYFLRSVITDNACPLKGRIEKVYRIQVLGSNRIELAGNNPDRTIGLGQSSAINIHLLRPDSALQNNVMVPVPFTYAWTETSASGGLPHGLNPADQYKKNIVVTPTRTTRYFLSVTSNITGCRDTTSVLVRIGSPNSITNSEFAETGFTAFPNPYTDKVSFKINLPKKANYQLIIYNILGQEADRINLLNLQAGENIFAWENACKFGSGQYVARLAGAEGEIKITRFTRF